MLPHCRHNIRKNKSYALANFNYKENSDMCIIATNCVGGEIYSVLDLKFNNPFINISIDRNDFVRLCLRFKEYMSADLSYFDYKNDYGVRCRLTLLDGESIFIYFPHDSDFSKVQLNWNRRKSRINYNKLVFINDDLGLNENALISFSKVNAFRKIVLTSKKEWALKYEYCHLIPSYEGLEHVKKYNEKSYKGGWNFQYVWNWVDFLNGR